MIDDIGKKPKWNETFQIPIDSINDSIHIVCYDEDTLADDLIGETRVKISEIV